MNISVLKDHFELMHLDDWIAGAKGGMPLPRLACAITFDDGWRDNYEYALPVLRRQTAPATIFLVSQLVGKSYGFWPTRISRVLSILANNSNYLKFAVPTELRPYVDRLRALHRPINSSDLDPAVTQLKCRNSDAQMSIMVEELEKTLPNIPEPERDLMNWEEVRAMADSGLVRYGSHSQSHVRLTAGLDPEAMRSEIRRSKQDLHTALGVLPKLFCYPNGDYTTDAVSLVRDNYDAAVTTRPGWNTTQTDRMLLRRVGLHEDIARDRNGFLARLALPI